MGDEGGKRKRDDGGSASYKKSKKGNQNKWKTSHHKEKISTHIEMGRTLDVEDEGIWVTFARGMKKKAIREFKELCDEYGERMYNIPNPNNQEREDEDEEEDIEASIQKELGDIKAAQTSKTRQTFTPVTTALDCLFFMKTMAPIEPGKLALQMCRDAKSGTDPRQRRCRYINRLTPVVTTDKATENGIERVARKVLASHFTLVPGDEKPQGEKPLEEKPQEEPLEEPLEEPQEENPQEEKPQDGEYVNKDGVPFTYAIRHNIRNHETFKSDAVVQRIAGIVDTRHKVNLGKPEKVILVEIFQYFCGVSVVDGAEWEELKRYNLNALCGASAKQKSNHKEGKEAEAKDESKAGKDGIAFMKHDNLDAKMALAA